MLLGVEMPYSLEAEQSILGAILVDPSCISTLAEKIQPDCFYRPQHQALYTEIIKMFTVGSTIDFVTVLNAAEEASIFESSQEAKIYLTHLVDIVPSVSNLGAYIDIVTDKKLLRNIMEVSADILGDARESGNFGNDLLDLAEQRIYSLRQGRSARALTPIKDAIVESYDTIMKLNSADREQYLGIKTGFSGVDAKIGGLNKSDLVFIAARPGMGKTSFALNIAENVAIKGKKTVAIFSLEMSTEQIATRMLSEEAMVESHKLRDGTLEQADWTRLAEASQFLGGANIFIDDTATITIPEIKAKCRRIKGLELVIIDYLQLMSSGRNTENRVQEVSEMTRNLKLMAKELGVPVVVLSQLSRATESRTGHKPMLSDLRESGSTEQDADLVIFLYRESYYQLQEGQPVPEQDTVDVIVSKNRHGETGSTTLRWDGKYTKFYTIEEGYGEG